MAEVLHHDGYDPGDLGDGRGAESRGHGSPEGPHQAHSHGVGLGFVYKGHRAQPVRESRSAREDEPAAPQGNFEGRVAKMVREDEPTTPRDPTTRDDEPVEGKMNRQREGSPGTMNRRHQDGLGKMNQPRGLKRRTPSACHLTTALRAALHQ